MNNEIKVMNNDEIRDFCIKKDLKIFELEQELQQKENIIKEVREYINNTELGKGTEYYRIQILQILDKEKE